MANIRVIPRLDIKGSHLIKGIHLEGLRVVGDPKVFAANYFAQGADELIFMDAVASLYQRNHLAELVGQIAENVFIPITVGGGIRSVLDAKRLLRSGADKIALNTAAVKRPELLTELSRQFGSQCVVLSIDAKKIAEGKWEVMTDGGRERSSFDVVDWATKAVSLGAGEILLTSVDQEGTLKGFDLSLLKAVSLVSKVPVIASGGMGSVDDAMAAITSGGADAISAAHVLHYGKVSLREINDRLRAERMRVRNEAA